MKAKKWIPMFFISIILALAVTAAFNIMVDPFGVFGDRIFNWYSYDETNNPRVAKIAYLDKNYKKYDSYIIGSSSAASYPTDDLNKYMNASFYNLFVYGCDTKDYCHFARYIIDNYNTKNIILNLGINELNEYDTDHSESIVVNEHADVTGENKMAFYGRFSLCNPKYSFEKIYSYCKDTELPQAFDVFLPESGSYDKRARDVENTGDTKIYREKHQSDFIPEESDLDYINECIDSVAYIKKLCNEKGVNLTVICSPVYETQWKECDESKLADFREKLAKVTDYWDFAYTPISEDSRYFYDETHFRNAVGSMVLARIFGNSDVYYPEDFGCYVDNEKTANAGVMDKDENASSFRAVVSVNVPALMYHDVSSTVQDSDMEVSEDTLKHQLKLVSDAGYHTVTSQQLIDYVYHGAKLPEKPVWITFDDGYAGCYEKVYPVLKMYNMKATFFAIGSSIGHNKYKDTAYRITPHFSYAQADEMMESGLVDVESHTYDMHQWAEYENTTRVRSNCTQFADETDREFINAVTLDVKKYNKEYNAATGRVLDAMSYTDGQYSVLSEIAVHENGIKISMTTSSETRNTIVKGLPQTLYAMSRYNLTDSVSDEAIMRYLRRG